MALRFGKGEKGEIIFFLNWDFGMLKGMISFPVTEQMGNDYIK